MALFPLSYSGKNFKNRNFIKKRRGPILHEPRLYYLYFILLRLNLSGSADHVTHIITSCRFACKEFGCFYSAFSKNSLGICSMLELDHLVLTCKNYLMLTYDSSAANCGDTDLLIIAFFTFLAAVIYIMILIIHSFINAVCQRKCSTTWCV